MAGFSVKREIIGVFSNHIHIDYYENVIFYDAFTNNESLSRLNLSHTYCFYQFLVTHVSKDLISKSKNKCFKANNTTNI